MISREIPITVFHGLSSAYPPDGNDLQMERQKHQHSRLGFKKNHEWFTQMLTTLIQNEYDLETGAMVRVTMEVVRTET